MRPVFLPDPFKLRVRQKVRSSLIDVDWPLSLSLRVSLSYRARLCPTNIWHMVRSPHRMTAQGPEFGPDLQRERPTTMVVDRQRIFVRPQVPVPSPAASIRSAISFGCETREAWLAARLIVALGFIRFAIIRWFSGWIIRSWVET